MSKRRTIVILLGALVMLGGAMLMDRGDLSFTGYCSVILGVGMISIGLTWEAPR